MTAASFSERWARDNLARPPSPSELATINLFLSTCNDEEEANRRARRYYTARGPGGVELWQKRHPDEEDILSSCQDAYIVPLKVRTESGRRVSIIRLPAPATTARSLSAKALLSRWLMIMDIRLHEDTSAGDEVVFIDVSDLQPSHLKNHFKGSYWKDFIWCIRNAYPHRFSEIHIINTEKLKTMSLLLLHIGLYLWRRKIHIHSGSDRLDQMLGEYFPVEGFPYEYGGKAGAMKDLNDEWTKKLLSNSKWLQSEESKFLTTELKAEHSPPKDRQKTAIGPLQIDLARRPTHRSYDMIRTSSCRSLNKYDELDLEDSMQGAYRSLQVNHKNA